MKWHADIAAVDNGFIVTFYDCDGARKVVYEEKENLDLPANENDKEHITNMLWDLLEFFGQSGSKHDRKRLTITYGDKVNEF